MCVGAKNLVLSSYFLHLRISLVGFSSFLVLLSRRASLSQIGLDLRI